MAYDTKTMKRDGSGKTPAPQHFNPTVDDYEPQYGRNNAGRVEIYGPDGNPISVVSNKLAVRAAEIEAILGATNDAAVIDPTLTASEIALLKGLLKQMRGEGTAGKSMPVTLYGSKERILPTLTALATPITAGNSEVTNVLATAGALATALKLCLYAGKPVGATAGTHSIQLDYASPSGKKTCIIGVTGPYNVTLELDSAYGLGTDNTLITTGGFKTISAFQDYIAGRLLMFGSGSADKLVLTYTNNTDGSCNARTYYIVTNDKAVMW